MGGRATPVKTTRAASKKNKTMRHMLITSVMGAVIYAIVAFLVVLVSTRSRYHSGTSDFVRNTDWLAPPLVFTSSESRTPRDHAQSA